MVRDVLAEAIEGEEEDIDRGDDDAGFGEGEEDLEVEKEKKAEIPEMVGIAMENAHRGHGQKQNHGERVAVIEERKHHLGGIQSRLIGVEIVGIDIGFFDDRIEDGEESDDHKAIEDPRQRAGRAIDPRGDREDDI